MSIIMLGVLALGLSGASEPGGGAAAVLRAGTLQVSLDGQGRVVGLYDEAAKRECLLARRPAALLSLTCAGKVLAPVSADLDRSRSELRLGYAEGVAATVKIRSRPTHLALRLASVSGARPERVDWGPFPIAVSGTIGETIAVCRDEKTAIGVQALTIETCAAASATEGGAQLLAWSLEHEGGVIGSKVALFGCPARDALATIGRIEVAEGLPHPMLGGVWAKVSPDATRPYLICSFGEGNVADCVDLARQLGFRYIYHPGPFETWGHFKLNPSQFPDGDVSMHRCVEKAAAHDIGVGVHTLTAFITPNDPYVTPAPDPRLARLGSARLTTSVDAAATVLPVDDPRPFTVGQSWGWSRRFALLGREVVEYAAVSEADGSLTGCTRGMFGTSASAHAAGADIGRLATHAYGTFYPGTEGGMVEEMTARLVQLFRGTGLVQISFDGLEGLSDYGYPGDYTRNRFVQECWDGWRQPAAISDASNLLHFPWHIHTRMNWGEPWGKALREGMPDLRLRNQDYFDRNLFPHMLGWFEFRTASPDLEATTLDEVEWMLSKAAGFDAGFAIVAQPEQFRDNAQGAAAIAAVREWERAHRAGAFTAAQRERLQRGDTDWHLEPAGKSGWSLWPLAFPKTLALTATDRGAAGSFTISNSFGPQPLRLVLRAKPSGGAVVGPALACGSARMAFDARLEPGQYLVLDDGTGAVVCDANWREIARLSPSGQRPQLVPGENALSVECRSGGAAECVAQVRVKLIGPREHVGRGRGR